MPNDSDHPPADAPTPLDPVRAARWVLTCLACHASRPCDRAEVSRYVQTGFPACCGAVMSLGFDPRPAVAPPTH